MILMQLYLIHEMKFSLAESDKLRIISVLPMKLDTHRYIINQAKQR